MLAPIEYVGFLAGFLAAIALSPQIIKSWKTKSTKDLSIPWLLTYLAAVALWVVYAYGIKALALGLFASIELFVILSLLILKLKYK